MTTWAERVDLHNEGEHDVDRDPSCSRCHDEAFGLVPKRKTEPIDVYIGWGEQPEHGEDMAKYSFQTDAEVRAFITGVQEATGWGDYVEAYVPGFRFCGVCDEWFLDFGPHADQNADDHYDDEED